MRSMLASSMLMFSLVAISPAHGETVVAVGTDYGAQTANGEYKSTPLVLRLVAGGVSAATPWIRSALPQPRDGDVAPPVLMGVTFSAANTAWAFGGRESGPILYRSDDAGTTWVDAAGALPDVMRFNRVRALSFTSEKEGWIVSTTPADIGPYVWKTGDGGASWDPLPPLTLTIGSILALRSSNRNVQLLRGDGDGTMIRGLEGSFTENETVKTRMQ